MDLAGCQKYLDSINTVSVEAAARVPNGPEVDGMEDLKADLLKDRKEDVAANLLRRLLTYGLGWELTCRDRFAVDSLLNYLKMDGLGMRDMIVPAWRSPLFLETETLPNHER